MGDVTGVSKLQQLFEQLCVKEEDFLWWNSNAKINVVIPPQLNQLVPETPDRAKSMVNRSESVIAF